MIYKTHSSLPDHVRIVFELPSSVWAHRISVLGEFNNWHEQGEPLYQDRDGKWRVAIDLPVNRQYEFHYLVDGKELIDRHADGLSKGDYLEQKSIVSTMLPCRTITLHHRGPPASGIAPANQVNPNLVPPPQSTEIPVPQR